MSQLVSHARMLSGMLTVIILNSLPLTRSPFVSASLSVGLVCAQPLTSFVTFLFFCAIQTHLLTYEASSAAVGTCSFHEPVVAIANNNGHTAGLQSYL